MAPSRSRRGRTTILVCTSLVTSTHCLIEEEIAAYGYFGKSTSHGEPQAVARYVGLSNDQFEELALSGRPFVVEDGGKDQPFVGWKCDDFRQKFPNGVVKIEYIKGMKATWSIKDKWENEKHKIPNADPGGPQYAPWYWGVKAANDEDEADTVYNGGKNPYPDVQSKMRIPSFFRSNKHNKQEVFGSPEFWFSMPQAGAAMHMDGHCESTYAIQLSGKRKWRLGWAPPVPNGTLYQDGTYGDGSIYGKNYAPPLEGVVSEGEAIFMPSAFLHETTNIGDSCAVSLTFQLKDPIPSRYWRYSLRHLRRSEDFQECWELMGNVAQALPKVGPNGFPKADAKDMLKRASHAFHDSNEDGVVTAEEQSAGMKAWQDADKEAQAKAKRKRPKSFAYIAEPKKKSEL